MLSNQAKLLLDIATQEAKRRGHNPVVPVHIVAGLIHQDRKKVVDNLSDPAIQDEAATLKSMSMSVLGILDIDPSTNSVLGGSRSEIERGRCVRRCVIVARSSANRRGQQRAEWAD